MATGNKSAGESKKLRAGHEVIELRCEVPRYMIDFIEAFSKTEGKSRGYIVRRVLNEWIKAEWHKHTLLNNMMRNHGNVLAELPDAQETIPGVSDWEREE